MTQSTKPRPVFQWPANSVERDVAHELRSLARQRRTSLTHLVAEAINRYLDSVQEEPRHGRA